MKGSRPHVGFELEGRSHQGGHAFEDAMSERGRPLARRRQQHAGRETLPTVSLVDDVRTTSPRCCKSRSGAMTVK